MQQTTTMYIYVCNVFFLHVFKIKSNLITVKVLIHFQEKPCQQKSQRRTRPSIRTEFCPARSNIYTTHHTQLVPCQAQLRDALCVSCPRRICMYLVPY